MRSGSLSGSRTAIVTALIVVLGAAPALAGLRVTGSNGIAATGVDGVRYDGTSGIAATGVDGRLAFAANGITATASDTRKREST